MSEHESRATEIQTLVERLVSLSRDHRLPIVVCAENDLDQRVQDAVLAERKRCVSFLERFAARAEEAGARALLEEHMVAIAGAAALRKAADMLRRDDPLTRP